MSHAPTPRHVLFVFIDGVGLGPARATNPLHEVALPAFAHLAGGHPWTSATPTIREPGQLFLPIDANLGVEGLPQSGTGQATLFTGVNCAEVVGRHFGPYPHSTTRPVLAEHNLFLQTKHLFPTHREPAAFANAYPPRFFEYARRRDRWTVTTRCCLDADVRLRTTEDVLAGRGVTAEVTGAAWREQLGLDVPLLGPEEAGGQLIDLARRHRLTVFEYYLTDKAGHGRQARPDHVLRTLDGLFQGILDRLKPERELLVVTSDHGNIEDLAIKTHTRYPVPLIAYGTGAQHFEKTADLTDVTPSMIRALGSS